MNKTQPRPVLQLRHVSRVYEQGNTRLEIFSNLDLSVHAGHITGLVGPSGSGKSSLLHIAGLLEKPTAGEVHIAGRNCSELGDDARTRIRRYAVGFVYQAHHLLPDFSARENVVIPQLIAGTNRHSAAKRADELLEKLDIGARANHRPAELSGGEQQRVAIARALANRPLLLLADEPTGNLDPETAGKVHRQFMQLIANEGLAALIATHNLELARQMDRTVKLEHGKLVSLT